MALSPARQPLPATLDQSVPASALDEGSRNKIVYVHFRDIRGTPRHFQEVFLDEGDNDMFQAMQTYKEVGFTGPFMMDHTPQFPQTKVGDVEDVSGPLRGAGWAGRAFAVGYMRALIQAVYR